MSKLEEVLGDDGVHFFTKDIIRDGLKKDPVDAYYDVLLAAECLKEHMDKILSE